MKAIIDAKTFLDALDKVSRVLKRSLTPALEGLLVQAGDGRCVLTGTDLTTWLAMEVPAQGDEFGFVLPAPRAVARNCRCFDGKLSLELDETDAEHPTVIFTCGQRSGTFDVYPAGDYPPMPEEEEDGAAFAVNAAALWRRVERVKYAVDPSGGAAAEPKRTCVQFHGNDVFALDGCRAAWDTDPSLSFPARFMAWGNALEHLKLMGGETVAARVEPYHIRFKSRSVTLCSRREGAETFDLASAVPRKYLEEFSVSPKDFINELNYLSGFQSGKRSAVRFRGGRMVLMDFPDRCATAVKIEGRSEMAFGFDPRYMLDALNQFLSEKRVTVKLSGPASPIVLEAARRSDHALVLPVRLEERKAA